MFCDNSSQSKKKQAKLREKQIIGQIVPEMNNVKNEEDEVDELIHD